MKATLIYLKNGNGNLADGLPTGIRAGTAGERDRLNAMGLNTGVFIATKTNPKGYPDNGMFAEIPIDVTDGELAEIFNKGTRMVDVVQKKVVVSENIRIKEQLDLISERAKLEL